MLSLDLFNTVYERALNEGAVDDLEARRIHGLNTKMLELMNRAHGAKPEIKAALKREYDNVKAERDSYYRIKSASTNEAGLPDIADKTSKMNRLNQPGQVGTDAVTPQQRVNPNPNKGVVGHAVDWLRGKGGPGKEGPTYEGEISEDDQLYKDIGAGYGVYNELLRAWEEKKPYTIVPMPGGGNLSVTRNQIFNVLFALKNMKDQQFKKTLQTAFSNLDKFMVWSNTIKRYQLPPEKPEPAPGGIAPGGKEMTQANLPLKERSNQKKNSKSVDTPQSSVVQRYLTKVRREAPNATSDIEAVAKHDLEQQTRTDKTINDLKAVNARQDQALKQAMSLDQQQGNEINDVESQLGQLSQKLQLIKTAKPAVNQPVASSPATPATPLSKTDTANATQPARVPTETPVISIAEPASLSQKDQEIYTKVKDLETELKSKIDAMASWNKVAQKDDESRNELEMLRKDMERTKRELNHKIKQLKKSSAVTTEPRQNRQASLDLAPGNRRVDPSALLRQRLGQTLGTVDMPRELPVQPDLNILSQDDFNNLAGNLARTKQPVEVEEGQMSELDAMRQDLELMSDRQFKVAYGMSKAIFKQRYRTLLAPAPQQSTPVIDEHGGGIGPKQHWQDLMQENKLAVGDPIVVTGPNEFEGKTGEIYDFAPSGTFVIVDLYNHGKHSMHLSDIAYNEYADQEQDEEDDWYDNEDLDLDEGFQDFNKVEPYAVCLAGKPVKKFDYYEDARRFHDNWKKKLYREGDKAKADKITLMPLNLDEATPRHFGPKGAGTELARQIRANGDTNWVNDLSKDQLNALAGPRYPKRPKIQVKKNKGVAEAGSPAQQAAIAIAMKKAGKKPKQVNELEVADLVRPGAQADTPPRRAYSIALQGRPGKDFMAEYAWEALNSVFPREYPMGTDAAERKVAEVAKKGSAIVKTGIASEDIADTYVSKLSAKRVPTQFWRIVGGELEETKADPTGSWVVYNSGKVKRFKTHTGAKAYAEKAGGKVASSEYYADKIQKSSVQETIIASGPSKPLDDRAIRKIVWDTMKIDADTGEQALHRALAVLAKKPQSRMVKDLQDQFQSLADRLAQGLVETTDVKSGMAKIYNKLAPKIERYRDSFLAGQLYDELENYAELHGAEAEFKRMMAGARNRAHMEYDTNPGGFQNWFWFLPFGDEDLEEGSDLINMSDLQFYKELLGVMVIPVAAFGAMAWNKAMNTIKLYRAEDVITALQKKGVTVDRSTLDQIKPLLLKLEQAIDVDKDGDTAKELANRIQQTVTWGKLKQANPDTAVNRKSDVAEEKTRLDPKCWSGKKIGSPKTKVKGGVRVNNCVPAESVNEEYDSDSEAVEIAIIKRILVAHTDLIMEFGLDKVTQAIEEVAYNVGDVDEIGTSDVSAYVHQVKQILGVE